MGARTRDATVGLSFHTSRWASDRPATPWASRATHKLPRPCPNDPLELASAPSAESNFSGSLTPPFFAGRGEAEDEEVPNRMKQRTWVRRGSPARAQDGEEAPVGDRLF